MWLLPAILVLVLLAPKLLPIWARYRARSNLQRTSAYFPEFAEAPAGSVPAGLRDALAAASADLTSFGFEFVGFMQSHARDYPVPRVQAVLRHPGELTFAVVGFAIADRVGVVVDFETLFGDGWWLRTVNRRGHFMFTQPDTGRIDDPFVTTVGEQWRYHHGAIGSEAVRARRDSGFDDFIRHKNIAEGDETAASVRAGFLRVVHDGRAIQFTETGARLFLERLTEGAKRVAAAPPLAGVLAMRCPPDDLERKYQVIASVNAKSAKSPARWAFWVSLVAFALSALVLPHWRWLLWLIPFLLLHELGHWSAMRLFGHRDARIRFIPFLGAATLTTKQFRKLSHEMIVLLAGPVPGIVLGLAIFRVIDFGRNPYAMLAAIMLVTINGLNLLPLHPLDGGRIVHALLTAGRPRLDVALKALAGAAFVVGAIIFKDATLAILAAVGFLMVRPGLRLARQDGAVRGRPGFGPTLTPEGRRRLIFEVLPEPRVGEGPGWVQLTQQLEVSVSHGTPRLWPALPWGIVYAACLGGLVAWGVGVFSTRPSIGGKCPPRTRATRVACDGAAAGDGIDWNRVDGDSMTRNPFSLKRQADYPLAAFVWCEGKNPAIAEVLQRLWEVRAANELCPALPWESLPADTSTRREHARWTLSGISLGAERASRAVLLAHVDRMVAPLARSPKYDPETTRLYKASLDDRSDYGPRHQLAERIGRSAGESCKRLGLVNVYLEDDGADEPDEDSDEDADHVDGGAVAPPAEPRVRTIRLSVQVASPGDFAPLGRYLCEAGCQVDVLPYGSMDPRLRACF
jgi:Zn-dependent protease